VVPPTRVGFIVRCNNEGLLKPGPVKAPSHVLLRLLLGAMVLVKHQSAQGQWVQTTSLPDGYQEHALVYASGSLYQTGGSSASNAEIDGTNVFYSQVNSDGTIGVWKRGPSLPEPVFDHTSVAANGFIYVLGGNHYSPANGDVATNLVYCSKINSDGSLSSWQLAEPLPDSAFFQSAAVWNNRIYVIGGWTGSYATNGVFSATIQSDGSLSPWIGQAPMPDAIYTQGEVANGLLYVLGGIGGNQISANVYYTKINHDGTLAGWNRTASLPGPMSNLASVRAGGRIFAMGGWNGSSSLNGVFMAAVAGDGSLSTWSTGTPMPQPMFYHAVAVSDSYIYLSGGATPAETTPAVYFMALPAPPATPTLVARSFTNGNFRLQLASSTNTGFGLLASTNLTSWTNIGWGFTGTNGSLFFQDTNAASLPTRFYRAYWPLP
jgi:Kelch motif